METTTTRHARLVRLLLPQPQALLRQPPLVM